MNIAINVAKEVFNETKAGNEYLVNIVPVKVEKEWDELTSIELVSIFGLIYSLQLTAEVSDEEYHKEVCSFAYQTGWKYSPVLDRSKKHTPLAISYTSLSKEQRKGLEQFRTTVKRLLGL